MKSDEAPEVQMIVLESPPAEEAMKKEVSVAEGESPPLLKL